MKPNKQTYIELITDELNKGNIFYTDVFKVFLSKFKVSEPTFATYWKKANEAYKGAKILVKEAKDKVIQANEIEALKSGLKSKLDRLLELQKQVESLETELKNNIMIVHTFSDGELIQGIRPINALEKASINKTIMEIRAEISKIEGDYAPLKTDNTHDFKQPPPEIQL